MKLPSERAIVFVIAAIGVAALLWLIAIAAYARPMSNVECAAIANDAGAIAQMRDRHEDASSVQELTDKILREHLGEPDSYIQFETDITFMVQLVPLIYASEMSAKDIAEAVYVSCRKHGYGVGYRVNELQPEKFHKLAM